MRNKLHAIWLIIIAREFLVVTEKSLASTLIEGNNSSWIHATAKSFAEFQDNKVKIEVTN